MLELHAARADEALEEESLALDDDRRAGARAADASEGALRVVERRETEVRREDCTRADAHGVRRLDETRLGLGHTG